MSSSPAALAPPHEPRAMKNAPKGPRSLVARRELEERIRRGRAEAEGVSAAPPVSYAETAGGEGEMAVERDRDKDKDKDKDKEREDSLRRLVLKSQRSKGLNNAQQTKEAAAVRETALAQAQQAQAPAAGPTAAASAPAAPPPVQGQAQAGGGGFSLDDLAVSFITETIQTLIPGGGVVPPPPPSVPTKPASVKPVSVSASTSTTTATSSSATRTSTTATSSSTTTSSNTGSISTAPPSNNSTNASLKASLAAKQRRLEAHIAESKTLMAQLAVAKGKQEKERILRVMRERSRMMEEESTAGTETTTTTTPTTTTAAQGAAVAMDVETKLVAVGARPPAKLRWPGSMDDVPCVLIISDDEESEGEEED
ncbi:hypothetical protein B0H14DRAFT_1289893 [Mycena olivaceomarginata]|nr:hypothetical protein B0H14DRAFT_1289893 [Mycena olivaceomarginata]